MKKLFLSIIGIASLLLIGFFVFKNKPEVSNRVEFNKKLENTKGFTNPGLSTSTNTQVSGEEYSDAKTFDFDTFHGSKDIEGKFKFLYPASWFNDGQYFSSQKIEYYDLYSIKASTYFDLIKVDIFDKTELKYQIDESKRKSPDTVGKIDGKDFKRYDLIDYGTYGGQSAGRVIVYVGPKIKIDGDYYYLVFHWEEKPLTASLYANDPEIFERIVLSLKFI